jgi:hypothetical protein
MKLAFVVYTQFFTDQVMGLLTATGIDYYTRWENVVGKGRGTEPHIGTGTYASTNAVLMIGFEKEEPLEKLIAAIVTANAGITRPDDRIRLFQLPLDRIV